MALFATSFTPHCETLSYRDMHHERKADIVNSYIIERNRKAYLEVNETRGDLVRRLQKPELQSQILKEGEFQLMLQISV
jgi:hypothetical protein